MTWQDSTGSLGGRWSAASVGNRLEFRHVAPRARLLDFIRLLSEGKSVTNTALDCGYSSVSAFIAAIKGTFGYTPGRL
jgi:methylphosphotriester-DNA--protein-cysteine methyltransferase